MTFLKKIFKPNINKMIREGDYDSLLTLLSHDDPEVQFEAVQAIGKTGDSRASEMLLGYLENGVSLTSAGEMRFQAQVCTALGELGEKHAIPQLQEIMEIEMSHSQGSLSSSEEMGNQVREARDSLEMLKQAAEEAIRKIEYKS